MALIYSSTEEGEAKGEEEEEWGVIKREKTKTNNSNPLAMEKKNHELNPGSMI